MLCHHYYQELLNQIQDPIFTWEQEKPTLFQDMYTLVMNINYCYWKYDYERYYTRQAEKEVLKSYSQKQEKASISGLVMASQNKTNPSSVALSTKNPFSKLSLSLTPKKQPNFLWVDFSSKLANNGKLTSNECKKCLKNNLYLYCGVGDHKLDSCPKKQTMITLKGHGASATADPLAVAFKKLLEKQRAISRTLHRLRAILNFSVQQ